MIDAKPIEPRNPLLVIAWTFGLYVLVFTTQYVYFWLGSLATGASFGSLAGGEVKTPTTLLLRGIVGAALGIPALSLAARYLWRRPLSWLRLRFSPAHLAGGAVLGAAVAFVAVGVLAALGSARIVRGTAHIGLLEAGATIAGLGCWALFVAILEETVFRGMATRELALRWGWPVAAIAGGVYFSAIHLISLISIARTLTPPMAFGILGAGTAASVLFVALYVRSRTLWLPIGFHAGWNFALSAILGTTMSGKTESFGLLTVALSGPTALTGGVFGVETSVVSVAVMLVAAWFVLRIRRGAAMPLSSRPESVHEGKDAK